MNEGCDFVALADASRRDSELLRAVRSVREDGGIKLALGGESLRALSVDEIASLEAAGNCCPDWNQVRVAIDFDPTRVRASTFVGRVILGRFSGNVSLGDNLEFPAGIHASTISDSVIGHDCLVRDVRLLHHYVVAPRALLFNCGCISTEGATTFGNGMVLSPGVETGGRDIAVYAEINVTIAAAVAQSRARPERLQRFAQDVAEYVSALRSIDGIIERGATVRNTGEVRNSYLGPYSRVDGATMVSESTLLSNLKEPAQILSGSCVRRSILQWGTQVETLALVDDSVLTEHSGVERHGKVSGSILGPNTTVAEGEVTASLVGPLVGFHHQALLIAALWPEGKGNIAYGANVGSNHTSRSPDQEFWNFLMLEQTRPSLDRGVGKGILLQTPRSSSCTPSRSAGRGRRGASRSPSINRVGFPRS